MGDVSGDHLPDLVSLDYVEDVEMLERPDLNEKGDVLTVSPASFTPGLDRLTINDGAGGWTTSRISESSTHASSGLGVVSLIGMKSLVMRSSSATTSEQTICGSDLNRMEAGIKPPLWLVA